MIATDQYLSTVSQNFDKLRQISEKIEDAAAVCVKALRDGGKIIFCGNGGSAADSQHLAAELMGRFLIDRTPLPALALTVDTSALTAIGNDYGYECVFSRQLRGIGKSGDVLVGLSTSGTSKNIVKAFAEAKDMNIDCIALTGMTDNPMSDAACIALQVPSQATNHIQEMHIAIGHIICGIVEADLCSVK